MQRKHAFTLIELMVVVAIISVLIAILLPSLGKSKELARGTVCGSKFRQLFMIQGYYAEDNKGYFVVQQWSDPRKASEYWYNRLGPYFGHDTYGAGVHLRCPSGQPIRQFDENDVVHSWGALDYGARHYTERLIKIKNPASFAGFWDVMQYAGGTFYPSRWTIDLATYSDLFLRHNNATSVNAVFMDGHAELVADPTWSALTDP